MLEEPSYWLTKPHPAQQPVAVALGKGGRHYHCMLHDVTFELPRALEVLCGGARHTDVATLKAEWYAGRVPADR